MGNRRKVARLLAGTCLLAGTAGAAHSEVRSLNLINTHTQERASVVFKRDGVYDQTGLQELNRLLRDWRRNEVTRMDPQLFDLIWEVYRDTGAREPIHIVCGYRSPATNNALRSRSRGVAKFSQHMLGKAMDFYLPDVNLSTLRETGMKKQIGGVGFYPTSGSPFVHMDTGSVRAWPRMTREQLVRLFPDGKTAHLPADGNPLPGYQTALAEAESRKAHGGSSSSSTGGGLLAALFGGGSSSSSSYSASAGEDEEEAAPAPRRQQELRQGPLPQTKVASAARSETPPGIADGLVPVYRSKPIQPQVRFADPAPPPAPVPASTAVAPRLAAAEPPQPTVAGKGSLVGLPIATPLPQPSPRGAVVASAIPSRYGPTGNELPPGWVQGPSGKPAGEVPQQVAALAMEPMRGTPIAVPVPEIRPGSQQYTTASLAYETMRGTPIAVPLPSARPGGSLRVASLDTGSDPAQAFAALTGERDQPGVALGYAASSAPEAAGFATASLPSSRSQSMMQTASLGGDTRAAGEIPSRYMAQPPSPTAGAVARSAAQVAKADRIADPTARLVAGKSDRASEGRLYDTSGVGGRGFAQLRHPDQDSLSGLFAKPGVALATGFGYGAFDELAQRRFSGPAIVALAVTRTE